jgi:hypothetical protein
MMPRRCCAISTLPFSRAQREIVLRRGLEFKIVIAGLDPGLFGQRRWMRGS